jgi:alpha-beta hydrolase superfamily lysophospholipase
MNQMQHEEGTFTGTGDLSLVWQAWLPDEPPRAVLVIVHGFGEHCGRYRHLVDYLVPRGFAIYGFDLRGHGRSEGQRGAINSWDEFREDVARFLHLVREAQPDSPLFLMGHSMGGLIVSNYAVNDQSGLTGVILSSPQLAQPHVAPLLHAASRVLSKIRPICHSMQGWTPRPSHAIRLR